MQIATKETCLQLLCRWPRRALHVVLVVVLLYVVGMSTRKLAARKVGVTQASKNVETLLYPSVTMCPFYGIGKMVTNNYDITQDYENMLQQPMDQLIFSIKHAYIDGDNSTVHIYMNKSNFHKHPDKVSSVAVHNLNLPNSGIQTCTTYNPPGPSNTGFGNGLFLTLNLTGLDFWLVTLHNKGHHVPSWNKMYGSTFVVSSAPRAAHNKNISIFTSIDVTKGDVHCLNEQDYKCDETGSAVDFNGCMKRFYAEQLGCVMPWDEGQVSGGYPRCTEEMQYRRYLRMARDILDMGEQRFTGERGCLSSCKRSYFETRPLFTADNYEE